MLNGRKIICKNSSGRADVRTGAPDLTPSCCRFVFACILAMCIAVVFSSSVRAQVRLDFNDAAPTLETGTALQQGARYRFRTVAPGTDALVTLTTITAGTTLIGQLDDNASNAFRFQPVIRTTARNTVGYVRFDFQLVKAGTSTPRAVPSVKVSAQDIDGTTGSNREFIEYVGMQSTSVNSPTALVTRTAVAGGVAYMQQSPGVDQAGIGVANQYEFYGTIADSATSFAIIAGNVVGTANCTATDNTCNRLNSYAFDPASANVNPPAPDVSITKTGPASVNQNNAVTYTLVARNNGPTTAHGATVTDNVPSSLTGVTISCVAANGAVCPATTGLTTLSNEFIPTFPSGGQVTFTITGTAPTVGTLTNTATIAPPNGSTDPQTSNNTSATITTTVSTPPNIGLFKSCPSPANCTTVAQEPNTDLTYQIAFANTGGTSAANLTIIDAVPVNTDYKIGSVTATVGTTGLTFAIEFSSNYDAASPTASTWTYAPTSAAGGAPAGYDRLVKAVRWRVAAGTLSNVSPNNAGSVSFISKIR